MGSEQYDVSPAFKALFEKKQKQRAIAKEYYRNLLYNPHRPPSEGMPFDPALQRYGAMSAYHVDFFKPGLKYFTGYTFYIGAFVLTYLVISYGKNKQEAKLRSGQVSYADRDFKLII